MKKYIFFTMNIGGINGAEQYIYNKMNYLQKIGYEVFIFSARPEKIMIDGFNKYADLVNPVMRFYPSAINKKERNSAVKWILSVIDANEDDSFIIESSNITSSLWGELIAKELKAKHLVVIMQEKHNYNSAMREFLEFKLKQHELSGIFDDSVQKMLLRPEIELRPDMRVKAFCNNSVQDCEDQFSSLLNKDADITIGSIGRLEKPYVLPLIKELKKYCNRHFDKSFNLLLIGGCADKRKLKLIKDEISQCNNVKLLITNQIYPIPKKLLVNVDVFVSASGSSAVSYYSNIPTIRIHHFTAEPIGIIGCDFPIVKVPSSEYRSDKTLEEYLERILESKVEISYIDNFEEFYYERMHNEFERQLKFAEDIKDRLYYNILQVNYTDFKYVLCSLVCKTIGVKNTYRCLEIIRKVVRGWR